MRQRRPVTEGRFHGNFPTLLASEVMSSASTAHDAADFPSQPINLSAAREMDLLRKAQRGDRAAYGQMVLAFQDRLFNAVLRMVGNRDEARELTQEAFTKGLENIGGFRGDAGPYTWLFRIAMNLAISKLRKEKHRRTFSLDRPSLGGNGRITHDDQASSLVNRMTRADIETPDASAQRRELQEQVLAALGRVDAEYRAILVMRDIEGFDYQQMADVLDLPLGTLKSRLFRARLSLREELKGYMADKI
jgi:RNA polymerase sigma-70 factor, ECF subfamily